LDFQLSPRRHAGGSWQTLFGCRARRPKLLAYTARAHSGTGALSLPNSRRVTDLALSADSGHRFVRENSGAIRALGRFSRDGFRGMGRQASPQPHVAVRSRFELARFFRSFRKPCKSARLASCRSSMAVTSGPVPNTTGKMRSLGGALMSGSYRHVATGIFVSVDFLPFWDSLI